jgi:predicted DNA-binding WGR domain protein
MAIFLAAVLLLLLPPQDARPLPDPGTFYAAVRENLARAQQVIHWYAYKERRTDLHTNPFGRIGTGGTRVIEVYPSANAELTYRRLVERNGVPVGAEELAEQDRAYRRHVADVEQRADRRTADDRRRRAEEDASARQRANAMIDDVVNMLLFKLEGRVMHNGEEAIAIAFAPKPDARPKTRQGRLAQNFTGTIWVRETDAEVMHVEAHAVDNISFGLGIVARLNKGTTATLTRRPVPGGVWMPTELTLSGRGRAALFRRLVVDYSIEWFDYAWIDESFKLPASASR